VLFVAVDNCISVARVTNIKFRVVSRQQADARQLWVSTNHSWWSELLTANYKISCVALSTHHLNLSHVLLFFIGQMARLLHCMWDKVRDITFDWRDWKYEIESSL